MLFGVEGLDAFVTVLELGEVGLAFVFIELGLVVEGVIALSVASERVHRVNVVRDRLDAGRTLEENSSSHFEHLGDTVCGICEG